MINLSSKPIDAKRVLKLLFASVLLMMAQPVWSDVSLMIVTDPWPPYAISEDGVASGLDVEIVKAVFQTLGTSVEFQFCPWKRCLQQTKNLEADAILDVSLTPARQAILAFPDEPLSIGETTFFVLKGRTSAISGLSDLNGLKAGAMLGYNYCEEIDRMSFALQAERANSLEQLFRMLLAERVDFVIENKAAGLASVQMLGVSELIEMIPNAAYCKEGNFLAFARKPGHEQRVEQFDNALKAFKKTDAYRQILQRYGMTP